MKQKQKKENLKQLVPTAEGRRVFMLAAQYIEKSKYTCEGITKTRDVVGLTQYDAINEANRRGARILTNKEFQRRLVLTDIGGSERETIGVCVWTGTFVAYKGRENANLGDVVKQTDQNNGITCLLEVPKEYRDEKNAILVVNQGFLPDGKPLLIPHKEGNEITYEIADKSQIELLQKFPSYNGWHKPDEKFGIPMGEYDNWGHQCYLWRQQPSFRSEERDGDYVGLVARHYGGPYFHYRDWSIGGGEGDCTRTRLVDASISSNTPLGVLISTEDTIDLKRLIENAEFAVGRLGNVVDRKLVAQIRELIDAVK